MIDAKEARKISKGAKTVMKPYLENLEDKIKARSLAGFYDYSGIIKLEANSLLLQNLVSYLGSLGYYVHIYENEIRKNVIIDINWKDD